MEISTYSFESYKYIHCSAYIYVCGVAVMSFKQKVEELM